MAEGWGLYAALLLLLLAMLLCAAYDDVVLRSSAYAAALDVGCLGPGGGLTSRARAIFCACVAGLMFCSQRASSMALV